MLTYCLKYKKDAESVDSKMLKTKDGRPMSPSKCAVCGSKKSSFMSSFKSSKFWVEEILFGSGLINFSIRFLNIWHEEE